MESQDQKLQEAVQQHAQSTGAPVQPQGEQQQPPVQYQTEQQAPQVQPQAGVVQQGQPPVGTAPQERTQPSWGLSDDPTQLSPEQAASAVTHAVEGNQQQAPQGPSGGMVIEHKPEPEPPFQIKGHIDERSSEGAAEYLKDQDERLEFFKKLAEEQGHINKQTAKDIEASKDDAPKDAEAVDEVDEYAAAEELNEKFSKAMIIIDKTAAGSIPTFTGDDYKQIEHVDKIIIQQVETIDLETLKISKPKEKMSQVLKKSPALLTKDIILPASGYRVTLRGASAHELLSLRTDRDNTVEDTRGKWSVVHNCIVSTSIGKLAFNEFLEATAQADWDTFVYGILCATYPKGDKFPIICRDCEKQFDYHYNVGTLLRAEKMSDKLIGIVSEVADASHILEMAKDVHSKSQVKSFTRVRTPGSGHVYEIHSRSAHDFINNSVKQFSKVTDPSMAQASALATSVRAVLIPQADGTFAAYDDASDVAEAIYSLLDKDLVILVNAASTILNDITFDFGLMNVKCPHCGSYHQTMEFDISSILFYRYQQVMNSTIE